MRRLPPFIPREDVHERLQKLFPEGSPHRNYCTREIAASTVFTMLYIGAIEGSGCFLAPKHVYRMSDAQAGETSAASRIAYSTSAAKRGSLPIGKAWYADTTREPIRDETLRQGLISVGAASQRNLPTTSSKGRYYLLSDFAELFDPTLQGEELSKALGAWRAGHLHPTALARIDLIRSGASPNPEDYLITFPNGETQRLSPGESSVITKAVVERFAPKFLSDPHVIWISESGNKVVKRNDIHAKKLGLRLETGKLLPDIILLDLDDMTIVFIEVVATDGPIDSNRREALLQTVLDAGHSETSVAFVTAFMSRGPAFRRTVENLAWNTFVWLAAEPDGLITLRYLEEDKRRKTLHSLLPTDTEGCS